VGQSSILSKVSPTPILDLEQSPPEPSSARRRRLIALILGLVLGGLLILTDQGRLHGWPWPACNGLLLIPALYVGIAVHELGHLVAGWLVGLEAGGISVGPLVFTQSGKSWVVRFESRMWFGGFFKPLTSTIDCQLSRFAWLVAGGPIASLALAIVCGIISVRADGIWNWVGTLCWASSLLVVLAGIPYSSGLNKSDGARLWQLVHHPQQARRWVAILALSSEEAKGLRPREWNSEVFNQTLDVDSSASEYLHCQLFAYYRRLDEGREADALEHLERLLATSARAGKPLRQALFLEAASASSIIRKSPMQARVWLDCACKLRKPESTDAVDASIAMCEGRYEEAASHRKNARERVTRQRLDSGLNRFTKEKWAIYEAACGRHQG
jgi:hypothetical protein